MSTTTKHPLTRLGKAMRAALEKLDRGGAWLARQIGVVEPRISEWSYGVREPTSRNLVAMARVLDVPLAKLAAAVGGRKANAKKRAARGPRARRTPP